MATRGTRALSPRLRLPLAARADAVELLDSGCLTLPQVEQNLEDLARLNRLPGGTSASIAAIRRLSAESAAPTVADIGTGCADMPLAFARLGWRTVAVDSNPDVLVVARRATAAVPAIEVVEADARRLPLDDDAVDVVHASLLAHHLAPDALVAALREMGRVGRLGVVVNDLRRGAWPMIASWVALAALARSPVTRSDGLTSIRAAYTLAELDRLAGRAGLAVAWRSTAWWPRVVTAYVAP